MKKIINRLSEIMLVMWLMCGPLPQSPHDNPEYAVITVMAINNSADYTQPVSVVAGKDIAIRFGLKNYWFVDSVTFEIRINNEETGIEAVLKNPGLRDTIDTSFVFPSQGTGTLLYTVHRNNTTTWDDTLIFNIAASGLNRPPVWSPTNIEMFSGKGVVEERDLSPYASDPDGDKLMFAFASSDDGFTMDHALLSSTKLLEAGDYEIGIIVSDGTLTDTATVHWKVYSPPQGNANVNDDVVSVVTMTPVTIDVFANDDVPSGSFLSFVSQGNHGKAIISNGRVVYTSVRGYTGKDTLFYLVNGKDTGNVYLTVTSGSSGNRAPIWFPDTAELYSQAGIAANGNAANYASDPDNDELSYTISLPDGAGFTSNGSVISSAAGSAAATYTIAVTVSDGTNEVHGVIKWTIYEEIDVPVTINNDPVNASADGATTVEVLENDVVTSGTGTMLITEVSQGKHGKAVIQGGTVIVYTPDEGFTGDDTLFYIVNGHDTGWVYITVEGFTVELKPDVATVDAGKPVTINVLENDKVVAGEGTMTITSVGGADHGTVALVGTEVVYTPEIDYIGTDHCYYIVNGKDTGWIDITINGATETHTITFDKGASSASGTMDPLLVASGAKTILRANVFENPGYTFAGWATAPSATVQYDDGDEFPMGTEDVTLYAIWTENASHTITYDKNDPDAIGAMDSQAIPSGATIALSTNTFTKDGWSFMGWATSADGAVAFADGADYPMGDEDAVLYATWSASDFTVTFNKNDPEANGSMLPQAIASGSTVPLSNNAFSKSGWSFEGWATSPTGEVVYTDGASYTMGSVNVILYAIWSAESFSITFNKNDPAATGTMEPQAIASGSTAPLSSNAFSRSGWSFEGWATSADGNVVFTDGAEYTMGTEDVILYAKWSARTFTVTFDKNDAAATGAMTPQSITTGSSVALKANAFTKNGWSFEGWATSADGNVVFTDGAEYTMGTGEVTLYAKWSATSQKVTFDKNDAAATGTMTPQSISTGSSVALKANAFVKDGWVFEGWATSANGAVVYADGAEYTMGTGDVTLYAKWSVTSQKITFDKNDAAATGTMTPQTIESGSTAVLKANTFLKTGWSFAGWATSANGAVVYTDGAEYTIGSEGVTLYAKWTIAKFKITFIANGGTGTPPPAASYEYQSTVTIPGAGTLSKTGADFNGWNTKSDGTGTPYQENGSMVMGAGDITLYAQWKGKTFTITVTTDGNGTVSASTLTVDYGKDCSPITATPGTGYDFSGWTGDVTGTDNPLTITKVTANMTVEATFAKKEYTVTFVAGEHGNLTGTLTQTVEYGGNATPVTAVADENYHFVNWTGSAGRTSTANPITAGPITASVTITANFSIDQFTVTYTATNGTVTPAGVQTVDLGASSAPVTAKAAVQYYFTGFEVTSTETTYDYTNPITISNVRNNYTIRADFTYGSKSLPISSIAGIRKMGTSDPILLTFCAVKQTEDRTVVHFDISSLTDTVKSAILVVPLANIDAGGEDGTFIVYPFPGDGTVSADEFSSGLSMSGWNPSSSSLKYARENFKADITGVLNYFIANDADYLSYNFRYGTKDDRYWIGSIQSLPDPMVLYVP